MGEGRGIQQSVSHTSILLCRRDVCGILSSSCWTLALRLLALLVSGCNSSLSPIAHGLGLFVGSSLFVLWHEMPSVKGLCFVLLSRVWRSWHLCSSSFFCVLAEGIFCSTLARKLLKLKQASKVAQAFLQNKGNRHLLFMPCSSCWWWSCTINYCHNSFSNLYPFCSRWSCFFVSFPSSMIQVRCLTDRVKQAAKKNTSEFEQTYMRRGLGSTENVDDRASWDDWNEIWALTSQQLPHKTQRIHQLFWIPSMITALLCLSAHNSQPLEEAPNPRSSVEYMMDLAVSLAWHIKISWVKYSALLGRG